MSVPGLLDDRGVGALVERRRKVRLWWSKDPDLPGSSWNAADGDTPVGLALSGGGIRSATFSIGLIQALAKAPRDALGKIDVLSTVSGGGYAGCFFRSLFVPAAIRGIAPSATGANLADKADQYRLARTALASDPCVREIVWPPSGQGAQQRMRNPMWWLREHSRYLAPTGMTDYGFAIAYIARNWLAMAYLVVLACVGLGAALVGAEALALQLAGRANAGWLGPVPISPLLVMAGLPIAAIGALMIAYWTTQAMSTNEPDIARQRAGLRKAAGLILLAALGTSIVLALAGLVLLVVGYIRAPPPPALPQVAGVTFLTVIGMGVVISLTGAALAWAIAAAMDTGTPLLTTELRRKLTGCIAVANRTLLIILVVSAIDSLGAWLAWWLRNATIRGGMGAAVLPALAFFIKKLPDWFGSSNGRTNPGGGIGGLLKRFTNVIALIIGLLLYAQLAILGLAVVHEAMWAGKAWSGDPHWLRWAVLGAIAWILGVVLGKSNGFINLSSLHSFYASRLTRAYLGASNVDRLQALLADKQAAPITENHPHDYIQPHVYGATDLPAPIHVINVTLNETIDPRSQIVSRDRKGEMLSVEPDGIRIDRALTAWSTMTDRSLSRYERPENISLGQWIAISGAAASSGMGRMTSLGFALAFTFANVRLGYWWWSPRICPDAPVSRGFSGWMGRNFGTFVYLFNEMTCRYSRGYFRKYLTDGGHYENSGAYTLIRRRVPLILVTDNGADPDYAFADLESLVRQVRIDLGAETTILGGNALDAVLARLGSADRTIFVDPLAQPDWRSDMKKPDTPAFVLVLEVKTRGEVLTMLWVKPRLLPGVPTDIAGYQLAMNSFPQQPTGDQFFDEAQWESYRKLGEISMTRLLEACPRLLADQPADEVEVGGLVDVDRGQAEGALDESGAHPS